MSVVQIVEINFLENPAPLESKVKMEITFQTECALQEDIEFKTLYVGSSETEKMDQQLDSTLVGPITTKGRMKIVLETEKGPDPKKIPADEILGVTVIMLLVSYKGQEFVRVGYYVNNSYIDPALIENPPETVQIDKIYRNILVEKPIVTRWAIKWDEVEKNE